MDPMTLMLIMHVVIIILVVIVLLLGTFTHANSAVLATVLAELLSLLKTPQGQISPPQPPGVSQNATSEENPPKPR